MQEQLSHQKRSFMIEKKVAYLVTRSTIMSNTFSLEVCLCFDGNFGLCIKRSGECEHHRAVY